MSSIITITDLLLKVDRNTDVTILNDLLQKSWDKSPSQTMKTIFYIRDCRGGKGQKKVFQEAIDWMISNNHTIELFSNIPYIPEYGTFKDWFNLMGTCFENLVIDLSAQQLVRDYQGMQERVPVSLLAKWLPTERSSLDRTYHIVQKICRILNVSPKEYRQKYLTPLRKYLDITERKMCNNQWSEINYPRVPKICFNRNKPNFKKHDPERFALWDNNHNTSINQQNTNINQQNTNNPRYFPITVDNYTVFQIKEFDSSKSKNGDLVVSVTTVQGQLLLMKGVFFYSSKTKQIEKLGIVDIMARDMVRVDEGDNYLLRIHLQTNLKWGEDYNETNRYVSF